MALAHGVTEFLDLPQFRCHDSCGQERAGVDFRVIIYDILNICLFTVPVHTYISSSQYAFLRMI